MSGRQFENHAYKYLRRRYPAKKGYQIERHPFYKYHHFAHFKIPDFVITQTRFGKNAVIAEAKYVSELRLGHIEQLLEYVRVFPKIRRGFKIVSTIMLIGPRDKTYVSDDVKEEAYYCDIEITRLPVYF